MSWTDVSAMVVVIALTLMPSAADCAPIQEESKSAGTDVPTVRALKVVAVREVDLGQPGDSALELSTIHVCDPELHVLMAVEGRVVADVVEYAHPVLSKVYDDRRRKIIVPKRTDELMDVDRKFMFFGLDDPPADTLWIRLGLPLPERDAKKLSIEGSISLVAAKRRSISFPDLQEHDGKLKWPELESAGVTCTLRSDSDEALVVRFEGEAKRIISATLTRGYEKQVLEPHSWHREWDRAVEYLFWFGEEQEDEALALNVEVAVEKRPIDVPIRLEELPLP
jgi:hypothetical protein